MTWERLLADRRVQRHSTSKEEIADLMALVERDTADASIGALSTDRRFAIAYNAALQLATIALACEGYRTTGPAHHQTTFMALTLAVDRPTIDDIAAYFELCRRKRNVLDYTKVGATSETEVSELRGEVARFRSLVWDWLSEEHPHLSGDQ